MGVVARKMKGFIVVLAACFIANALSSEVSLSEESEKSISVITHPVCKALAEKGLYCNSASHTASAANCIASGNKYWEMYGCSGSFGKMTDYKTKALFDVEDFSVVDEENEFTETEDAPEDVLMVEAAKAHVATLKKKGVKDADCKDLAKRLCKVVEDEVKQSQTVMNKVDDASSCANLGMHAIKKAKKHEDRMRTLWLSAQKVVTQTLNKKISISSQRFSSLKQGQCGFIFRSRNYLSAKVSYQRAVTKATYLKAKLKEATNAVIRMVISSYRQVEKCMCSRKKTRDTTWKVVSSSKTRAQQLRRHAKCKMMSCVLNGTPLTSKKCKGNLAKVVKKKLISEAEKAVCTASKKKKVNPVSGKPCGSKAGPICHGCNLRCFKTSSLAKCKASCKKDKRCNLAEWKASTKHCCDSAIATKKACKGRWARASGWTGYNICR